MVNIWPKLSALGGKFIGLGCAIWGLKSFWQAEHIQVYQPATRLTHTLLYIVQMLSLLLAIKSLEEETIITQGLAAILVNSSSLMMNYANVIDGYVKQLVLLKKQHKLNGQLALKQADLQLTLDIAADLVKWRQAQRLIKHENHVLTQALKQVKVCNKTGLAVIYDKLKKRYHRQRHQAQLSQAYLQSNATLELFNHELHHLQQRLAKCKSDSNKLTKIKTKINSLERLLPTLINAHQMQIRTERFNQQATQAPMLTYYLQQRNGAMKKLNPPDLMLELTELLPDYINHDPTHFRAWLLDNLKNYHHVLKHRHHELINLKAAAKNYLDRQRPKVLLTQIQTLIKEGVALKNQGRLNQLNLQKQQHTLKTGIITLILTIIPQLPISELAKSITLIMSMANSSISMQNLYQRHRLQSQFEKTSQARLKSLDKEQQFQLAQLQQQPLERARIVRPTTLTRRYVTVFVPN